MSPLSGDVIQSLVVYLTSRMMALT